MPPSLSLEARRPKPTSASLERTTLSVVAGVVGIDVGVRGDVAPLDRREVVRAIAVLPLEVLVDVARHVFSRVDHLEELAVGRGAVDVLARRRVLHVRREHGHVFCVVALALGAHPVVAQAVVHVDLGEHLLAAGAVRGVVTARAPLGVREVLRHTLVLEQALHGGMDRPERDVDGRGRLDLLSRAERRVAEDPHQLGGLIIVEADQPIGARDGARLA
mmetsp:Transcript_6548/g.13386  ORF Transcript_6548/g.13386 Transcript_6548/m.13386 type:complete len:218 (-) Transcript_6548:1292-1945(-)